THPLAARRRQHLFPRSGRPPARTGHARPVGGILAASESPVWIATIASESVTGVGPGNAKVPRSFIKIVNSIGEWAQPMFPRNTLIVLAMLSSFVRQPLSAQDDVVISGDVTQVDLTSGMIAVRHEPNQRLKSEARQTHSASASPSCSTQLGREHTSDFLPI